MQWNRLRIFKIDWIFYVEHVFNFRIKAQIIGYPRLPKNNYIYSIP